MTSLGCKGAVVLRNVSLELNRGKLRLLISKFGKISAYPDDLQSTPTPPSIMNQNTNLSTMDVDVKLLMNRFNTVEKPHTHSSSRYYDNTHTVTRQRKKDFPSKVTQKSLNRTEMMSYQPFMLHNDAMRNFNPPSGFALDSDASYIQYSMMSDPNGSVLYDYSLPQSSSWMYNPMDNSSIWYNHHT